MLPARASLTARRTATYRAQHRRVDPIRVLDDPLAIPLLGGELMAMAPTLHWPANLGIAEIPARHPLLDPGVPLHP